MDHEQKIKILQSQGVLISAPQTLDIGPEVPLERVHGPGTVLHAGTRLRGAKLLVGAGCILGSETPVTVDNCSLGKDVALHGGSHQDAVYLDRVVIGSGAHVRAGTLLEEGANAAHTVGLKQTVLLPFVTLGSLINFCDVLMAGGTSRRDHSEVGSSFIHFNFTPFGRHGDKATPSLIGDVPRGVMLRQPRIFLGGQAGLVGPMHVDYGTVLAAGFVYRRDHGPDQLVVGEPMTPLCMPFNPLRYGRIRERVTRNLRFIGNLVALWHWYRRVRIPFCGQGEERHLLMTRAMEVLEACIAERCQRLRQVAGYMEDSIALMASGSGGKEVLHQRRFADIWPEVEERLLQHPAWTDAASAMQARLDLGLEQAVASAGADYPALVAALDAEAVEAGTAWLQALVDRTQGLIDWD